MAKTSDAITGNLWDFCKVTNRVREDVARITGVSNPDEVIKRGWEKAYEEKTFRLRSDKVSFSIDVTQLGGNAWVEVLLRESNKEGERLPYYTYGANEMKESPREFEGLSGFAYIDADRYKELAHDALDEPWSFSGEGYDLLRFYLNGTFLRLVDEGKLGYETDAEGDMCVWCTGLVNAHYEDIFCFCKPNYHPGARQKWVVSSFCTSGSGHDGLRLRHAFGTTPPRRANYFDSIADTIYDGNLDLVVDYGHIMRRIHRIGIPALRNLLASSGKAMEVIDRASTAQPPERETILKELNGIIDSDTTLQQALHNALALAAERARARARYMYTSALPAWNPRDGGKVSFCLPLCLVVEERVDTVLVACLVKDAKEPYYEGKTIFDLPMAYKNVRAIQRTDGMTGWVSSAFAADEDVLDKSAFASHASTTTPSSSVDEGFSATPIVTDQNPAAMPQMARLVPKSDALHQLMVCDGDTVGLLRRPNAEDIPRLQLPKIKGFEGVSQIHGRFDFRDGAWTYTHEGLNWSDIKKRDGNVIRLDKKGQSIVMAPGDSISFTDSPDYRFEG